MDARERLEELKRTSPNGEHYRSMGAVQPIDLIESFKLGYHEGEAIAAIARWRLKGGLKDIEKAIWLLQRLLLVEQPQNTLDSLRQRGTEDDKYKGWYD